jgi:hypothetical protein
MRRISGPLSSISLRSQLQKKKRTLQVAAESITLRVIKLFCVTGVRRRFGVTYELHEVSMANFAITMWLSCYFSILRFQALHSSETSVHFYQTVRLHTSRPQEL